MDGYLMESPATQDILSSCRSIGERAPRALLLTEGPEHVVRYANPVASRLTGKGIDALLGRPLADVLPASYRAGSSALLDHVYRTGEPGSIEDLAHVDGERRACLWSLTAWPMLAHPRHLLVVIDDSTQREQEHHRYRELAEETRRINERLVVAGVRMQELADEAETARRRMALLAEAGQLLGTAFDTSSMLPAVAALLVRELCDHCAIHVETAQDAAFRSVATPEALEGQMARAVEHIRSVTLERNRAIVCAGAPGDGPGEIEIERSLRAIGFASAISIPLKRRTSTCGVLSIFSRSRRYDPADVTLAGEIAERIAISIDRAELYQHALDAARARDDLLAVVSHDLRNPLSVILLTTSLLAKSGASPEGAKAGASKEARKSVHVDRIRRSAEHMQHLLQDLVDSAKIDAGRFLIDRQQHALSPVMTEVIEMLTPVATSKSLRLEAALERAPADLAVWMDRERIVQVLTNLIGNAIKFTPAGGSITVGAERSEGEVRLWVRDTGPGIREEDLSHLFDRFWQARQTARLGTGLGLFIAKEIVEAHGGRIWAESEGGAGSTFFVTLSLSAPAP